MLGIVCKLYPNKQQLSLIRQTAGCCRFIYNYFLNRKISCYNETGKTLSTFDCCKELTTLKQEPDKQWLKNVGAQILQQSIKDLGDAYKNYFKYHYGFPKYRSKRGKQSFRVYYPLIKNNKIRIDKVGYVRIMGLKQLNKYSSYTVQTATVTVSPDGYCEVSILIKDEISKKENILPTTNISIGADLGIHNAVLTLSDGTKIQKPQILNELYLKREFYQSKRDSAQKDSHNCLKWMKKQWKISRRIHNIECGFAISIGYNFAKNYDEVKMEDLNVEQMFTEKYSKSTNININKSILHSCMAKVKNYIKYFCEKYSKTFILVNKFYPSSQICSVCGYKNEKVKDLSIRKWVCPQCHTEHDRDINAAINLLNWKKGVGVSAPTRTNHKVKSGNMIINYDD